jgi:hypothetical protein
VLEEEAVDKNVKGGKVAFCSARAWWRYWRGGDKNNISDLATDMKFRDY